MKKGTFWIAGLLCLVALATNGQELKSTVEIYHDIQELQRGLRVLYIAAHPDDENTRLISWLENDQHIETAYLSLTRGQGGQNLIGSEKGDALGVIRTYELLEARKVDGAEQFFTRAIDFGYSKSAEESFAFWGKEEILKDVVSVIRSFRPHVIITRFPPTRRAGHGHHEASAILAAEAFEMAADPEAFKTELADLEPWSVTAMYHNTSSWWDKSLDEMTPEQLQEKKMHRINIGVYNDLMGYGINEIAALARSKHRCQAFGTPRARGEQSEYLELVKGEWADDFLTSMQGVWKQSPDHAAGLQKMVDQFNFTNRAANWEVFKSSFLPLMSQRSLWALPKDLEIINNRVSQFKLDVSGVRVEVFADKEPIVINSDFEVTVEVYNSGPIEQTVELKYTGIDTAVTLASGASVTWTSTLKAPSTPSNPFWLRKPHDGWRYNLDGSEAIGQATEAGIQIPYFIKWEGQYVIGAATLHRKWNDRSIGEIVQPMVFVNPVSVEIEPEVFIVTNEGRMMHYNFEAHTDLSDAHFELSFGDKGYHLYEEPVINLNKGQTDQHAIHWEFGKPEIVELTAAVNVDGVRYNQKRTLIDYEHIPQVAIHSEASAKFIPLELEINPERKILYIPGSGDDIKEAIQNMGYMHVDEKNLNDLSQDELNDYDVVVTGIRAFNRNDDLVINMDKLQAFIKSGGNMISMYNTTYDLKVEQIGPYPMELSRNRVTDEHAAVKLLEPKHGIFNKPNALTTEDWLGWVQERGLYFAGEWDKEYKPLISWADQGEDPSEGALLYAKSGKGCFFYSGISFFRQLPAGVPGAYRLLANMIEYQP